MPPSEQPTFWQIAATNESALVAALMDLLRGSGWQTAKQLRRHGFNDRALRAIASASRGQIISGQKGYALIAEATVEDARHAAAWLRKQGTLMIQRAAEIERAMHKRQAA